MHILYTKNIIKVSKMSEQNISIITLSSDDEDQPKKPPLKKHKTLTNIKTVEELVILSDDEDVASKTDNNIASTQEMESTDAIAADKKDRFDVFLDLCVTKIENAKHKALLLEKMSTIKLLYKRTSDYVATDEFSRNIRHKIKLLNEQPRHALHCFNVIFQELKYASAHRNKEIDPIRLKYQKKVEKKLHLLHLKIRKLENAELCLDDLEDEDSSYIQLQRYKERAKQLYDKYCELLNEDAYCDRITHKKIRFNKSKYDCINKTIRKRYKNNNTFPTYYDIDKLIRKCVERNKLEISSTELEREIRHCFEALGNLLQKRRKQDLLDIHADYIICAEDPAEKDESLQSKLKVNKKEGEEKLNSLCTEFVIKQEKGEDYEETPDPVDSDEETGSDSSKNKA